MPSIEVRVQESGASKASSDVNKIEPPQHRRTRIVARQGNREAGGKVAARYTGLEAEMERLSQYGKSAKKSQAAASAAKPKKRDEKKNDLAKNDLAKNDETSHEVTEPVADAA